MSDEIFVTLVTTRVYKHKRRRKTVFMFCIVLATIVSFTGLLFLPGQIFDVEMIGVGEVFTGLVLLAICAIAAVATESRP